MRGFHELAWLTIAGGVTFGMLLSLMAGSRRTLVEWLGLQPDQAGGLVSVLTLVLIPGSIAAGLLTDLTGGKWIIALGSVLAAVSLLLLLSCTSQTYGRCLLAIVVAGMGAACLNVGTAVLMPRAFFDDNPVAATNLGFVFVGLGALLTPVVGDLLLQIHAPATARRLRCSRWRPWCRWAWRLRRPVSRCRRIADCPQKCFVGPRSGWLAPCSCSMLRSRPGSAPVPCPI